LYIEIKTSEKFLPFQQDKERFKMIAKIASSIESPHVTNLLPANFSELPVMLKLQADGSLENIGDVCQSVEPVQPSDNIPVVLKRFQSDKSIQVLPVVDKGHVAGIINRLTFLEENVIGMHGFAFQINHNKKMRDLMAPVPLALEANTPIKYAAQSIKALGNEIRVDNVCIIRDGLYQGIVDVNKFINAITEINLTLAKGANPLTGLPGNECIQREITERLMSSTGFDIAYVDIDNFKPYNDYYGFQKGDVVIKVLGEIITAAMRPSFCGSSGFCGHIGGDDFIIITDPGQGHAVAMSVIDSFERYRMAFHGEKDFSAGSYTADNRKGEPETFQLLSISIGIVNTLLTPVGSYAQLASLSTDVKKSAKQQPGSAVIVNRRRR
jgi:diguanylate cyclase (GGDEF)-like protein